MNLIVFGNCQGALLARLLCTSKFGKRHLINVPVKPVHLLSYKDIEKIYQKISDADLFIYQKVSHLYSAFATERLLEALKPRAISYNFPVCYFRGYTPELVYLKKEGRTVRTPNISDYHNINFMRIYCAGGTEKQALYELHDIENYAASFIYRCVEASINELRRRECKLDTSISDFIMNNWQKQLLFYTINHPNIAVIVHIANQILKILGENLLAKKEVEDISNPLSTTLVPMYKSIRCRIKNISADGTVYVQKTKLKIEDYVNAVFSYYKENDSLIHENYKSCLKSSDAITCAIATKDLS